jgi:hypothetical protein
MKVCEYGTVHTQCRCMGPKDTIKIECPSPKRCEDRYKATMQSNEGYTPKHKAGS